MSVIARRHPRSRGERHRNVPYDGDLLETPPLARGTDDPPEPDED